MTAAQPNIEILLAHQDWVRALARSLVADPSRADDVAQQTMLEAMTRPPRDLSRPKGWLARVAQNAARGFAREERRRLRREEAASKSDVVLADPADAAHRAASHKRLVDALFELEEPYHTVLLLRFFEDQQARQIAAQLDRPVATVRTQLQRGLDRLRERLDREYGDRHAWCAALLPLFSKKQAVTSVPVISALGALTMWKWILPAIAMIVALFVGYASLTSFWDTPTPATGGTSPAVAAATAAPNDEVEVDRDPIAMPSGDAPIELVDADAVNVLRGHVVDAEGRAVPGLTLAYHDPKLPKLRGTVLSYGNSSMRIDQPALRRQMASDRGIRAFARRYGPHAAVVEALLKGEPVDRPRAITDGLGRFEFDGVATTDHLKVEGSDWIIYGEGFLRGESAPMLVVGPAVQVSGRVVDEQGKGIDRVLVDIGFTLGSLPGFSQRFERTSGYRGWSDNSASDGGFDLGAVPAHPALHVVARRQGYVAQRYLVQDIVSPVTWRLKTQKKTNQAVLSGFVRHADGTAAAGARLVCGSQRGRADAQGRFEFEVPKYLNDAPLTAHLRGYQAAIVEGFGGRFRADPSVGRDMVLTLGGKALAISGRVLDGDGDPIVGARVLLGDGIVDGSTYTALESVIGEQQGKGEITDRRGSFTLRGLSDRPYNVRAIVEESLLVLESGPVAAGTEDLVLRASPDPFIARVEGVLVDRFDVPVVGAEIAIRTESMRGLHGAMIVRRDRPGTSDAEGRFVLEDCPREHVTLGIDSPDVKWQVIEVPTDGHLARVVVERLLRFKLRVNRPLEADSFKVVDAAGEQISSAALKPGVWSSNYVHDIVAENAPAYEVTDAAAELILLDGKREVRRVPLNLRFDALNEIDL